MSVVFDIQNQLDEIVKDYGIVSNKKVDRVEVFFSIVSKTVIVNGNVALNSQVVPNLGMDFKIADQNFHGVFVELIELKDLNQLVNV